jgi:hypothetical protein
MSWDQWADKVRAGRTQPQPRADDRVAQLERELAAAYRKIANLEHQLHNSSDYWRPGTYQNGA